MAELPRVPIPNTTTQPIKYNLSAADIAGPYTAIAQASDKLSGALSDVAVPLAEQAAASAVRRDDDGNLIVDKLPFMVGDAAKAARLTIAAKLQPQIETDLTKIKIENPNDPIGYQKAVSAYKPALMKGLDGTLAVGVDRMVDNTSQQHLRSLLIEKDAHDTSEFKQSMEAQITRINDQTQVLARQQGGVETKEYSQLYQDRVRLIDSLKNNPKVKLSEDKAQLLKDQAHGDDMGQSIVGTAIRQFQTTKNKAAAQRFLMDWAWGEPSAKLPLTPRQRDHIVSEGLKSLETMSAEDRKAITASKSNINGAVTGWMNNPEAFREAPWNDLLQAARAVGDDDGERQLHAFRNMQPIFSHLASQSPADRDRKINLIQHLVGGTMPGPPVDEAFTNAPGAPVALNLSDAATAHIWDQTVTRARTWAAQDAQKSYDDLKYSIDNRHPVTTDRIRQFADLAVLGRKVDLVEKLRPDLARLVDRGEMNRAESNAIVSEAKQAAAASPDPVAQRAADAVVKQQEADIEERNKSPAQYAVNHYGAAPLGPLVPEKPEAFTGEIANRAPTMAKFHQMEKEYGGASWVTEREGDQLHAQLTQTLPPEAAAQAVRTLGAIPDADGDRLATLTQKKVMEAVRDMGYSADPKRMAAAMQTQEELREAHPHEYVAAYGEEAERHLMTYQGLRGAFSPEELAMTMNRPVPGRDRKARKTIEDEVKKGMNDWSAEDVAYTMGTASTPEWTRIGRLTGSTPGVPADAQTRIAFLEEFKDGVATIVGSGVEDVSKARAVMAQKMSHEWAVSRTNGNTLMKYAPELIYNNPPLPGDPDGRWLGQQLDERIASIHGPQITPGGIGEPEGQPRINWRFERLVADAQTKYEFEHGLPPSYHVWITDQNGKLDLLKDATGSTRHRFDRSGTPDEAFTNAPGTSQADSPQGRAYEAKRIALQKAQKARDLQIEAFGPESPLGPPNVPFVPALRKLGGFMDRLTRPVPTFKAHAEHRDGE